MNADYLWDRSGPVDEQIADLERVLGTLRFAGTIPAIRTARTPTRRLWTSLIALAAVVALAAAIWFYITPPAVARKPVTWTIASSTGKYTVEEPGPIKNSGGAETGQWIETAAGSTVRISTLSGNAVTLSGETRALMVDLGHTSQRLELAHGSIYTDYSDPDIRAAPMYIVTPIGTATIAPGTACLVSLPKSAIGAIEVKVGRVDVLADNITSRLGRNSHAPLTARGVGTPASNLADGALSAAIAKFDESQASGDSKAIAATLGDVLKAVNPSDELTLWNLMHRADEDGRKRIIARARELTKSMYKLDSDALLRLDPEAMEVWWQMLESR